MSNSGGSADANNKNFFTEVETSLERKEIYNQLAKLKESILVQFPDKSSAVFIGEELDDDLFRMFKKTGGEIGEAKQKVLITFELSGDRYFISTSFYYSSKKSLGTFNADAKLYKLQRREMFRISIPPDFDASILIKEVDEIPTNKKLHLFDLSGGGAGLETRPNDDFLLAKRQMIKGEINVKGSVHSIKAEVRHVREAGDKKAPFTRIGIQFEGMSEKETQNLNRTVMMIHREVFSRLKV